MLATLVTDIVSATVSPIAAVGTLVAAWAAVKSARAAESTARNAQRTSEDASRALALALRPAFGGTLDAPDVSDRELLTVPRELRLRVWETAGQLAVACTITATLLDGSRQTFDVAAIRGGEEVSFDLGVLPAAYLRRPAEEVYDARWPVREVTVAAWDSARITRYLFSFRPEAAPTVDRRAGVHGAPLVATGAPVRVEGLAVP